MRSLRKTPYPLKANFLVVFLSHDSTWCNKFFSSQLAWKLGQHPACFLSASSWSSQYSHKSLISTTQKEHSWSKQSSIKSSKCFPSVASQMPPGSLKVHKYDSVFSKILTLVTDWSKQSYHKVYPLVSIHFLCFSLIHHRVNVNSTVSELTNTVLCLNLQSLQSNWWTDHT